MFIDKQGYYGENDLLIDKPVSRFVPYEYTEEEFNRINNQLLVPCFNVQTILNVILDKGWLYVNGNKYDISTLLIRDVVKILIDNGCVAALYATYENIQYLPAYLLTDFNNFYTFKVKANKSPFNLTKSLPELNTKIKGLHSWSDITLNTIVFDTSTNKEIKQTVGPDSNLYFEPSDSTILLVKIISNDFTVGSSLNINTYSDISNITNIIKNGTVDSV